MFSVLLYAHLEKGFRKGNSTEVGQHLQKQIILSNIKTRYLTLGILTDVIKAFDVLTHTTLVRKPSRYIMR